MMRCKQFYNGSRLVFCKLTRCRWWYLVYCVGGALSFVAVWMYYGIRFFTWLTGEGEEIIKYTIDVPNPPGDGRVMENPSIKV